MQLVLPFEHMAKAAQYMEPSVFEYVREGEIESFESFEKFDFLAFDWYDVHSERTEDYKMLAYVSRENLIIFTEGAAGDTAKKIMDGLAEENPELRLRAAALQILRPTFKRRYGLPLEARE